MKGIYGNNFAYANYQQGSVIDTQKGVYVDSRAMSIQQYNKYYRTVTNFKRPDMNQRQIGQFRLFYMLGEKLLWVKNKQNVQQINKLARYASRAYIHNHLTEIFGISYAVSKLAQPQYLGNYLRTDVEMEKIAKWAKSRGDNAYNLGLIPFVTPLAPTQEQRVDKIAAVLRQPYLKQLQK